MSAVSVVKISGLGKALQATRQSTIHLPPITAVGGPARSVLA